MTSLKELGRIDELERIVKALQDRLDAVESRPACKCSTLSATPAQRKAAIAKSLTLG